MKSFRLRSSTGRREIRPVRVMTGSTRTVLALYVSLLVVTETLRGDGVEGAATSVAGHRSNEGDHPELDDEFKNNVSMATDTRLRSSRRRNHPPGTSVDSFDASQVQCNGLQSKRYINDGFCRTLKPISEVLCTGYCVPTRALSDYSEFVRAWSSTRRKNQAGGPDRWPQPEDGDPMTLTGGSAGRALGHRCVDGIVRTQRVRLVCDNGDTKVYRVRVVKSCVCSSGGSPGGGNHNSRGDVKRRHSSLADVLGRQQLNEARSLGRNAEQSRQTPPDRGDIRTETASTSDAGDNQHPVANRNDIDQKRLSLSSV